MLPIIKTVVTALAAWQAVKQIMPESSDNFSAITRSEYDIAMRLYAAAQKKNRDTPANVDKVSRNQLTKQINERLKIDISSHELFMMWHGQITRDELPETRL